MAQQSINVSVPPDEEGFVPFECPACGIEFKLLAQRYNEAQPIFITCPSCGIERGATRFYPQDVMSIAQKHAQNILRGIVNNSLNNLERIFSGSKAWTYRRGNRLEPVPIPRLRPLNNLAVAEVPCCFARVKIVFSAAASVLYCPFCGIAHA